VTNFIVDKNEFYTRLFTSNALSQLDIVGT